MKRFLKLSGDVIAAAGLLLIAGFFVWWIVSQPWTLAGFFAGILVVVAFCTAFRLFSYLARRCTDRICRKIIGFVLPALTAVPLFGLYGSRYQETGSYGAGILAGAVLWFVLLTVRAVLINRRTAS